MLGGAIITAQIPRLPTNGAEAYYIIMQLTPDEIHRLSPHERLALIAQLWDSLEDGHVPLTAAQQDELDRRLEQLDHDRAHSVSWEVLKAELAQRCP
jgi:putative addiction module component (TIGR02574 family)